MDEKMREWLLRWAKYIRSDEANTDGFLSEDMEFKDVGPFMDHIATAVEEYTKKG